MKYGISGIKYQDKLEKMPLFNKKTARMLIGKKGNNLDKKIQRLLDKGYLINLKKGWYVSEAYINKQLEKERYFEYISNQLRKPSYLSLEYILSRFNLIPESVNIWTNVTLKTTRKYENEFGNFVYKNVKENLFTGYEKFDYSDFKIYTATRAKSLFDFLYLKKNLSEDLEYELKKGLRINWDLFSRKDCKEFSKYVDKAEMNKMKKIELIIKDIKNVSG